MALPPLSSFVGTTPTATKPPLSSFQAGNTPTPPTTPPANDNLGGGFLSGLNQGNKTVSAALNSYLSKPAFDTTNATLTPGNVVKSVANTGKSLLKLGAGFAQSLNPLNALQIPEQVGGFFKDLSGAAKSEALAQGLEQKAQASDIAKGKTPMQPVAKPTNPATLIPQLSPEDLATQAVKSVTTDLPASQQLAQGHFKNSLQSLAEDPYQIAPALLGVKEVLGAETGGTTVNEATGAPRPETVADTKVGGAIDKTISNVAKPVIKTGELAGKVAGKAADAVSTLAKYGTAQATGLSPKTIDTINANPEKFFGKSYGQDYTREAIGNKVSTAIDQRLENLSATGKEYQGIKTNGETVTIPKTGVVVDPIKNILDQYGVQLDKNGQIKTSSESLPMSSGDKAALQNFIDTFGKKDKLTSNGFLNARKTLSNMAKYDATKTDASTSLSRSLRAAYDAYGKDQITGLNELDAKYAPEVTALKQIKKDYLKPDGTFKDNALSKIANLTNAGREPVLARLEAIIPGISKEITILKAVEDIANAGGQKVGTYTRAATTLGTYATAGLPGAIVEAILTNPKVATQILAGFAKLRGIDISGVLGKVFNAPIKPNVGLSIEDVGSSSKIGQSIKDLAEEDFAPNEKKIITIGEVQPQTLEVAKNSGLDLQGYTHTVDNYGLRHALKEHANDSIPLTTEDFTKIPEIIKNPDNVEVSDNPTRAGLDAIKYTKKYNGTTYYIEEVQKGNEELALKTMYKKETPSGASYAPKELRALRPTSEKSTTPSSVSEPSVAQTSESVKPTFKGFKDLSTKILEKLKGRSEVSKQFISDLTNSGDVKQSERDLIRQTLNDFPDKVPVKEFANAVKTELLPLERSKPTDRVGRYENITLPEELRGNVADYKENIYKSPIKTSAGDVHFSHFDDNGNYFAHTRVEDMANSFVDKSTRLGEPVTKEQLTASGGTTRRVIELQSDLFQKGRFESEYGKPEIVSKVDLTKPDRPSVKEERFGGTYITGKEKAQLEPYRNTWHERVIKEEVKQAAKDGKTKLQFPTGETAMKIEGLGANSDNWLYRPNPANDSYERMVNTDALKVGREVAQPGGDSWIITDVLGDGKFKAVPKNTMEHINARIADVKGDSYKTDQANKALESYKESFDISGKVDTNNPIYKFYEKTVGKYLINNLGATRITDPQGVQWYQVPIKKSQAKAPIIAKKDTKSDLA